MASKQEWMIIVPDHPDSLEARMKVRPQHLEELTPNIKSGKLVLGGASLDAPIKEGEGMKSNGSALIVMADTKEEAVKFVTDDIYARSGVWNTDAMTIFPFKSAVRQAL